MQKFPALLPVLLALVAPAAARENWQGMKAGLTPQQATALVGQPLIKNRGHGYEVWSFDQRGEVTLFQGRVLYWDAPQAEATPAPSDSVEPPAAAEPARGPGVAAVSRPATVQPKA